MHESAELGLGFKDDTASNLYVESVNNKKTLGNLQFSSITDEP